MTMFFYISILVPVLSFYLPLEERNCTKTKYNNFHGIDVIDNINSTECISEIEYDYTYLETLIPSLFVVICITGVCILYWKSKIIRRINM